MTINEMIKKFEITIVNQAGQEMLKVGRKRKPTTKQLAGLKANKDEIMTELKHQQAERKAAREAANKKAKAEYIENSDLRRYLAVYTDELGRSDWSVETLIWDDDQQKAFRPDWGVGSRIALPHVTTTMEEIRETDHVQYGMAGVAWEITDDQEDVLIAEQEKAKAVAREKRKTERKSKAESEAKAAAEKKAERQAKFDQAKETGKRVEIKHYSTECNDPSEECSLDIITEYAMPDGSVETERIHTY
jgi:hypothetical protein